jgi:drug/metabolite transporter (DMT)-like permease
VRDIISHRRGAAALVAASAIWGLWNSGYKYAVSGLPIAIVLAVMLLTAAAALWAVVLIRGRGRVTSRQLRQIALAGLLDPAISYAALGIGLTHVAATTSAMFDGTEACFVVAFAALIARRSPGIRAITGVLLSAAGIALLGATRSVVGLSVWDLLVLAGVASAALCNVLTDRVLDDDLDPLTVTAYQMGFAALCALPLLAWHWQARETIGCTAGPLSYWAVAIASGAALAAAFLLYNYAIAQVPVTTAGMILNTIPLFGVVAAICVLGERITWAQGAAAAVILIAFCLFEEGTVESDTVQAEPLQPEPVQAEPVQAEPALPDALEHAEPGISRTPVLGAAATSENLSLQPAEV